MHYYQFNIGDYKSHTEHLSEMEDLAYRRMLDLYYTHERPLSLEIEQIARLIRMRTHCECIANVLREYFKETPLGWVNTRAEAEIGKMGEKSAKASESAKARWKAKSNTQTLQVDANALQTHSERIANGLRSECEGNATQDTEHITQDTRHKTQKEKLRAVACPPDVDPQVWIDWLALRKAKKAPVTQTVIESARRESGKALMTFEQFLREWCNRGSQGLKAEWIKQTTANKAEELEARNDEFLKTYLREKRNEQK